MIELRNSSGQLDFALVTPEIIAALDEPRAQALMALMQASDITAAAVERRNAAVGRVGNAIANEEIKMQAHADASSPIPFTTAKIEEALGRPLNASEMQEARANHTVRVRGLLEQQARQAAVAAFNNSH
jgi:hypothetical protein